MGALRLDGFDHTVDGVSARSQTHTDLANRLVMHGVAALPTCTDEFGEPSRLDDSDVVLEPVVDIRIPMLDRSGALGRDVLIHRAAMGNGQELATAANAEHRFASFDPSVDEREFVEVASPITAPGWVNRGLAIALGRNVRTARKDEAVTDPHKITCCLRIIEERQEDWSAAGASQRRDHPLFDVLERLVGKEGAARLSSLE